MTEKYYDGLLNEIVYYSIPAKDIRDAYSKYSEEEIDPSTSDYPVSDEYSSEILPLRIEAEDGSAMAWIDCLEPEYEEEE